MPLILYVCYNLIGGVGRYMGSVIGYLLLVVFVLCVCSVFTIGTTLIVKRMLYEIKMMDNKTKDSGGKDK